MPSITGSISPARQCTFRSRAASEAAHDPLSGAPITQLDFDLYKKTFSSRTFLKIGMG